MLRSVSLGSPWVRSACFRLAQARRKAEQRGVDTHHVKEGKGRQVGLSGSAEGRDPRDRTRRDGVEQNAVKLAVRNFGRNNVHSCLSDVPGDMFRLSLFELLSSSSAPRYLSPRVSCCFRPLVVERQSLQCKCKYT